jgi:hypothetical protein
MLIDAACTLSLSDLKIEVTFVTDEAGDKFRAPQIEGISAITREVEESPSQPHFCYSRW